MDHIGSLKVSELLAPMLDRKTRSEKSVSHWFLAGEQTSNAGARARAREQKNLDYIGFLKANVLVGSDA